jgi:hypothetical protein
MISQVSVSCEIADKVYMAGMAASSIVEIRKNKSLLVRVGIMLMSVYKNPAVPCERVVLNLLSQVGRLTGTRALTDAGLSRLFLTMRPSLAQNFGCDITRTAGIYCYIMPIYGCKGSVLVHCARFHTLLTEFCNFVIIM